MKRTRVQSVIALVFLAYGVGQLLQVPGQAFGADALPALAALHVASGLASLVAAIGIWRGYRPSWILALVWGAVTVGLVLSLPSLLQLSEEEASGMPIGAGLIAALAMSAAVYLYRSLARER